MLKNNAKGHNNGQSAACIKLQVQRLTYWNGVGISYAEKQGTRPNNIEGEDIV